MTPQEQQAYGDSMNTTQTVAQCRSNHEAAMAQLQARARSMGQTLESQVDPCTAMQRQGTVQR